MTQITYKDMQWLSWAVPITCVEQLANQDGVYRFQECVFVYWQKRMFSMLSTFSLTSFVVLSLHSPLFHPCQLSF